MTIPSGSQETPAESQPESPNLRFAGDATTEHFWTPVARAAARLELVSDEEPGSMQHFTTALQVGDLLARLHAVFLLSVLARFEDSVPRRYWFALARTSGTGDWLAALEDCAKRLGEVRLPDDLYRVTR